MIDLRNQTIEQTQALSAWNYKLKFTCEKCEMNWYKIIFIINKLRLDNTKLINLEDDRVVNQIF
jgi:hypothetical protein